jgi:HD-GYP domain-containing protein (c-di-GMP phosphodiesterase class II)
MGETRTLLGRISALRQRLEQTQGLAGEARTAVAALAEGHPPVAGNLTEQVVAGAAQDARLDVVLSPLTGPVGDDGARTPARQVTARARRVLERGRELLGRVRALATDFNAPESASPGGPDPLALLYRETVALLDTTLRTVVLLPDSASAQLPMCQGLEVTLSVVARRLDTLGAGAARRREESQRIDRLANLLAGLAQGQPVDAGEFSLLAEDVLAEARECYPLRFLEEGPEDPARFIAGHSLTVAQVAARVVRHDAELRTRPGDVVLAALLHDVGMLCVPAALLAGPGPLDDDGRRAVEAHCRVGADLVGRLMPEAGWLREAVELHHERLDGTGYPNGLRDGRLPSLPRLLAVCDTYAALCATRPHRPARATRTALADTLLLAEKGLLDRRCAECLLQLSFYPVGSLVELAHGAIGVVVATPSRPQDLNSPARPVVALLTDPQGLALGHPHHLDLAECENHSIVRTLSPAERRVLLGRRFPEWLCA